MQKGSWRWARPVLLAVVLAMSVAAPAQAWLIIGGDATRASGQIGFFVWGSGVFTGVDITETVDGVDVPVRTVVPPQVRVDGTLGSGTFYPRVVQWRCDRLTREFKAVGRRADGTVDTADYDIRTPSCRRRLALVAPHGRRARGSTVALQVRDRWSLGGLRPSLCVQAPGAAEARCAPAVLRRGASAVKTALRLRRRGHYRVTLRSAHQTLRTVVSSGVAPPADAEPLPRIVTTGDSLMQSVDAALADRLANRADIRTDVKVGSGLAKDSGIPADWKALPGQQVRRDRPAATVVFLGTNEGAPMKTPAGPTIGCCGPAYVAEYARRARRAMKTYVQGGRGAVVWINVPAASDPRRNVTSTAVNTALAQAADGLDHAAILDADALFTPGRVYRASMLDRGRTVRVRQGDGVHLSAAGATIAARQVVAELERLGVV